ncbi:hypothetical protein GCM10010145_67230 [Streptomyces ruber]|uniref:Uncharacterized protein n=2 Tax=Streptomyces TaxID=1883 RepID=A0A918BRE5_9ACTN|nr:hypothetical protein [Streptomyces ruber]GGQ88293.1 hypothetical protein GCM10010145_67230 [Streptomyces ruber]
MPTPYGSRGAMAFGAEELRVLRRALALALNARSASPEDVHACLRLAESVEETARESARLRAFLLADLARYRAALPGAATGYLALLEEALDAGHRPAPDDLAALRALRGASAAAALLERCAPARQHAHADRATGTAPAPIVPTAPTVPMTRTRLTALSGGLSARTHARAASGAPGARPPEQSAEPAGPAGPARPARGPGVPPKPAAPGPERRPVPTPGEVFPPRRKPVPPADPPRQLVVG